MPESDEFYRVVVMMGLAAFILAALIDTIITHAPKAWEILSTRIEDANHD